jgi:hypothetical protein
MVRSVSVTPMPPSPIASPGASPFGRISSPPAWDSRAVSREGPTRSSNATAGTLSDNCSALRTGTMPWKVRSKFSGA